jgi:hypothetical protein
MIGGDCHWVGTDGVFACALLQAVVGQCDGAIGGEIFLYLAFYFGKRGKDMHDIRFIARTITFTIYDLE